MSPTHSKGDSPAGGASQGLIKWPLSGIFAAEIHLQSKAETLYRMRLGQPENQYFAPDGKPMTKEKAERLSAASETAELP
jgi:hypothetical protein